MHPPPRPIPKTVFVQRLAAFFVRVHWLVFNRDPTFTNFVEMVDRLDEGAVAADVVPLDYKGLYKAVGKALFRAHVEGELKSEIMSKLELFIEPDPELPLALLDQKEAGKKLLLITNSNYHYTEKMMQHFFTRFLPNDMNWRDLCQMVGLLALFWREPLLVSSLGFIG